MITVVMGWLFSEASRNSLAVAKSVTELYCGTSCEGTTTSRVYTVSSIYSLQHPLEYTQLVVYTLYNNL